MSLVLEMISRNQPLYKWQTYKNTGNGAGFFQSKNPEKMAQAIFSQLCHPSVVELVAEDFVNLPEGVRIQLRTLCNNGNGSGHVRKGVQRLNEKLKGALLREERKKTFAKRVERNGTVTFDHRTVRPEVAGATRKYGILNPGKR